MTTGKLQCGVIGALSALQTPATKASFRSDAKKRREYCDNAACGLRLRWAKSVYSAQRSHRIQTHGWANRSYERRNRQYTPGPSQGVELCVSPLDVCQHTMA